MNLPAFSASISPAAIVAAPPDGADSMTEPVDVIVVGGGMVGATLAALLGRSGVSVAVVEGGQAPTWSEADPPDLRVSSVNAAAQQVFVECGAWAAMEAGRAAPFRRLRAWDASGRGETCFEAGDAGLERFGWFVENRLIRTALWQALENLPAVTVVCPGEPLAIEQDVESVCLRLRDGHEITGRLLVGADGARSSIRRLAGIDMPMHDYGQHALIVNAVTTLPQQDITWQRFTPSGPQAFLPLVGHHASLVWYDAPDNVRRLQALSDQALIEAILGVFPAELGGIEAILGRGSFPIRRGHARRYRDHRLALVGDAAHVIHPLGGQGLNLGILDAAALARGIIRAQGQGADVGAAAVLARYEARRRPRNATMIAAMDAFHRVFTAPIPQLRETAAFALGIANQAGPMKRLVMRHAMGLPAFGRAVGL